MTKPVKPSSVSKPRRLQPPAFDTLDAEEQELLEQFYGEDASQAYRTGNFFILYTPEVSGGVIVDMRGNMFVNFYGTLDEVTAVANALQTAHIPGGKILFETESPLDDTQFFWTGFEIVMEIVETFLEADDDDADAQDIQ
jgi:hypothetical protein